MAKSTAKKTSKKKPAKKNPQKKPIESYDHKDKKRANDPQLVWAGKAEHTSSEVPTISLHAHKRIDRRSTIEATHRRNGDGGNPQMRLFEQPEQNPPLREAIEFYKHAKGWTNRIIAGDSLLVMNSLLEKEGMAGKVQMVEIDEELIEAYRGTISLPFEPGNHKRVAVKIIDDRGIESLKIVEVG